LVLISYTHTYVRTYIHTHTHTHRQTDNIKEILWSRASEISTRELRKFFWQLEGCKRGFWHLL